jgi:hypothetical protein
VNEPSVLREWLKPKEVAAELDVPVVRVQRWLATGKLNGRKIGGLWFIRRSEIEAEYDVSHERPERGEPVPAEPGRSLGGDGDDVGRPTAVSVRRVENRGRAAAPGVAETAGRGGRRGSATLKGWTLPPAVDR